jgi:hypothetical protein
MEGAKDCNRCTGSGTVRSSKDEDTVDYNLDPNPNGISKEKIEAWCDDYAEICEKHGLYLCFEYDTTWIQEAGEPLDSEEAGTDMKGFLTEEDEK